LIVLYHPFSIYIFSLHGTIDDSAGLTSFAHVDHHTDDDGYENNSTNDDSSKCCRIVTNTFHLASSFVAVVVRTLVVAGATIPVSYPLTNSVGTLLVARGVTHIRV